MVHVASGVTEDVEAPTGTDGVTLAFGAVGISAVAQTTAPATAEPTTTEKVKEAGKDAYDATKNTT